MFAAVVTVACLMLGWVVLALGAPLPLAFTPLLVGVVILLPLAVGVAIVRHDLFDIDRMFSATTTWGLTLIVSAAVYAVVVFGASRALGALGSPPRSQPSSPRSSCCRCSATSRRHGSSGGSRPLRRSEPRRAVHRRRTGRLAGTRGDRGRAARGAARSGAEPPLSRPDGSWTDLRGRPVDQAGGLAVRAHGV